MQNKSLSAITGKFTSFKPDEKFASLWRRREAAKFLTEPEIKMILLTLFWIIYFIVHTALASVKCKLWVRIQLPRFFKYYRLVFNVVAFIGFVLIMLFQRKLPPYPIATLSTWFLTMGYALVAIGMVIIGATFKNYDTSEFLGTKPMNEFKTPVSPMVTSGLNAYVRHTIYSGTIVTLTGYLLIAFDYRTLIFFSIALLYIVIGGLLEEQKLTRIYGNQYIEYQKKVNMLVPSFK